MKKHNEADSLYEYIIKVIKTPVFTIESKPLKFVRTNG